MDRKKLQKTLAPFLSQVGSLYSSVMRLRADAYASGRKRTRRPEAFCVSVGNIAWGGSGKTPLADWLLAWAAGRGLASALLTRGYGGKSKERPLLVKAHTSPAASGDEPLMLARRHPEAYVLADPKRARALDWLEANTSVNFIVLDDAMQHLAVRRDLNLVLLRAKDLAEEYWGKVLPAGEWREGPSALCRASAFLLRMGSGDFENSAGIIKKRLAGFNKPVFSFDLEPTGLSAPGREGLIADLNGRPYALCTGVGSPEAVEKSAAALLGRGPEKSYIFADHHKFSARDLRRLSEPGLPLVMTAKDAVKVEALVTAASGLEYYVLESRVSFGPFLFCEKDFPGWFAEKWQKPA